MVQLFVKQVNGVTLSLEMNIKSTVNDLKVLIKSVTNIPIEQQRLIFGGRVLKDGPTLAYYNIQKECSIQLFCSQKANRSSVSISRGSDRKVLEAPIPEEDIIQEDLNDGIISEALQFGDIVIAKLIGARNLQKSDFWTGSSDPYVIFALGNNSSKSKIVKRNLNPTWNEIFGFRLGPAAGSEILTVLVFDFDNFTPDDFMGSVEIDLSALAREEVVDIWVKLENVKTGELHLQFRRSILTSPGLNDILSSLMEMERSWQDSDLQGLGITLRQLMGDEAWNINDTQKHNGAKDGMGTDEITRNPAIEYLALAALAQEIDWTKSSLQRIEKILVTQNMLPTPGLPCRHLWFSGISFGKGLTQQEFVQALRDHAVVKLAHISKSIPADTTHTFALVDFRSIREALLVFLAFQYHRMECQVLVGFGRHIRQDDEMIDNVVKAGFLNCSIPDHKAWRYCWVFLMGDRLELFRDLQNETPLATLDLKSCLICSQGANTLEVYIVDEEESFFLQSQCDSELSEWKTVMRKAKTDKLQMVDFKEPGEYECVLCHEQHLLEDIYVCDNATDITCSNCLRKQIFEKVASDECEALEEFFSVRDIRELLSQEEFNRYLDASLRELLESSAQFVKCPKCAVSVEFLHGNHQDAPDFANELGIDNRPLNRSSQTHYLENRLRCRNANCSISFCRACLIVPYHAGFDCDEYNMYRNAKHCRFCATALMPKVLAKNPPCEALINVCNNKECLKKRDQSCQKLISCGHPCGGALNDVRCMPCLESECRPADITQAPSDFCNICFTEMLSEAPCIELDCAHVFHYGCIQRRIAESWPGAQISFGFVECPLCKMRIQHPMLAKEVKPIANLFREIESRAYARLEYEQLSTHEQITEPTGTFYKNPAGYARNHFAFYMCFKCKCPYFGGAARCAEEMEHNFDPSELICGSCSGVGVEKCSKHGKDFIIFKCRFCCSPSTWFCWGTTHFCTDCHRRQEAHDYMTTKPRSQLPKCPGASKCPLKLKHPPNGEEFSLGCGLCRGSEGYAPKPEVGLNQPDQLELDGNLAALQENN